MIRSPVFSWAHGPRPSRLRPWLELGAGIPPPHPAPGSKAEAVCVCTAQILPPRPKRSHPDCSDLFTPSPYQCFIQICQAQVHSSIKPRRGHTPCPQSPAPDWSSRQSSSGGSAPVERSFWGGGSRLQSPAFTHPKVSISSEPLARNPSTPTPSPPDTCRASGQWAQAAAPPPGPSDGVQAETRSRAVASRARLKVPGSGRPQGARQSWRKQRLKFSSRKA